MGENGLQGRNWVLAAVIFAVSNRRGAPVAAESVAAPAG